MKLHQYHFDFATVQLFEDKIIVDSNVNFKYLQKNYNDFVNSLDGEKRALLDGAFQKGKQRVMAFDAYVVDGLLEQTLFLGPVGFMAFCALALLHRGMPHVAAEEAGMTCATPLRQIVRNLHAAASIMTGGALTFGVRSMGRGVDRL